MPPVTAWVLSMEATLSATTDAMLCVPMSEPLGSPWPSGIS